MWFMGMSRCVEMASLNPFWCNIFFIARFTVKVTLLRLLIYIKSPKGDTIRLLGDGGWNFFFHFLSVTLYFFTLCHKQNISQWAIFIKISQREFNISSHFSADSQLFLNCSVYIKLPYPRALTRMHL